jgi:hypothetical protein
MLLNEQFGHLGSEFAGKADYNQAAVKAMNATVLLRGSRDVPKLGFFFGSAVILGPGKEVSYDRSKGKWSTTGMRFTVVVSALHNLSVNYDLKNKLPPLNGNDITWNQDYADRFKDEVTIVYGAGTADMAWGSKPQASAAIDHVVPIFQSNVGAAGKMITIDAGRSSDSSFQLVNLNGKTTVDGSSPATGPDGITPVAGREQDSWSYDVVLLLSKDQKLYTYTTTPGKCDYMARVDLKGLSKKVVNAWSERDSTLITPVMRCRRSRDYRLLQTGYGNTSDSKVPVKTGNGMSFRPEKPTAGAITQTFQFKRSMPKASTTMEKFYFNTEYRLPNGTELVETYSGGLELRCYDGNNSTYTGDSGGPLLAFPFAGGPVAYLVGVSFGAGLATTLQSANNKSVWGYDNNVATSLGYFYENLYDLRFQNV